MTSSRRRSPSRPGRCPRSRPCSERVGRTLTAWVEARASVRIETTGPLLADHRQWICELPVGTARMPCGGTHVRILGEIESMRPPACWDGDAGILTIRNTVQVGEQR